MGDDGIGVVEVGGEVVVGKAKEKGTGKERAGTDLGDGAAEVSRYEKRADGERAERSDVEQGRPAGEGPNKFDAGEGSTAREKYIRVRTGTGERTAPEARGAYEAANVGEGSHGLHESPYQ